MANYVTISDVKAAMTDHIVVELSNDDHSAITINESVVTRAITAASENVDGYLRGRYEVPLTDIPTMIHEITLDLVIHKLYKRRPESPIPDAVIAAENAAHKRLADIRDSKNHLGIKGEDTLVDEPSSWKVSADPKLDTSGY